MIQKSSQRAAQWPLNYVTQRWFDTRVYWYISNINIFLKECGWQPKVLYWLRNCLQIKSQITRVAVLTEGHDFPKQMLSRVIRETILQNWTPCTQSSSRIKE